MFYELSYKIKWEKEDNILKFYYREEVSNIIKQLNRWLTPIKNKMINWMDSLEYIIVIEQNYDYIENWLHYDYEKINANWEIVEISQLSLNINSNFLPERKNITSELFLERNIWLVNDKKVNYKDWIIYINNEIFPSFNRNSKYWDIFELIFNTSQKKWNKIKYLDLEEEYLLNETNYEKLNSKVFTYLQIRDTIKNKLKEIREYFSLDKDIINLTIEEIIING